MLIRVEFENFSTPQETFLSLGNEDVLSAITMLLMNCIETILNKADNFGSSMQRVISADIDR